MHILIAPNAFKNSLSAREAAKAIEKGLLQSGLNCTCECFPIADGGDGTAELIIERFGGKRIIKEVKDPLGRVISSSFGLIDKGRTAVIEMADASGLRLLKKSEYDPLHATTYGTGQLIKYALDEGVNKIIIGVGGSATVDGGMGMVNALGGRFLNEDGVALPLAPGSLTSLHRLDLMGLDQRVKDCEIIVLCDVGNRLLGDEGAAAIFGPQKGATGREVLLLEASLSRLRDVADRETGKDMGEVEHGGAAGGLAAALYAFFDAKLVNGADYFLKLTGFEERLEKTDLVITGEGCIDEQTLQGKGPFAVACMANGKNIRVIGLAGKIKDRKKLKSYFDVLMAIGNGEKNIVSAMRNTEKNLIRIGVEIGGMFDIAK